MRGGTGWAAAARGGRASRGASTPTAAALVALAHCPPCTPHPTPTQVFYHLGDLDDALTYALGAGGLFDVNSASEYVLTILGERLCSRGS